MHTLKAVLRAVAIFLAFLTIAVAVYGLGTIAHCAPVIPAERAAVIWLSLVETHFPTDPAIRSELRAWHRARYPRLYPNTIVPQDTVTAYVFTDGPGLEALILLDDAPLVAPGSDAKILESIGPWHEWPDSTVSLVRLRFVAR